LGCRDYWQKWFRGRHDELAQQLEMQLENQSLSPPHMEASDAQSAQEYSMLIHSE
jgi:hypothetical protein